jgi:uncharacterized protein with PIN domain
MCRDEGAVHRPSPANQVFARGHARAIIHRGRHADPPPIHDDQETTMHEPSATGPAVGGTSPHVEHPLPAPGAPAATTTASARGDAVVLVALARLERDHVALLAALCDLEVPTGTRRRAKSGGAQPLSAALRDALAVLLRADLRQTQHALALAAEGRYGLCEGCQAPLASVALLTTPATTHCPSCAGSAARAGQVH